MGTVAQLWLRKHASNGSTVRQLNQHVERIVPLCQEQGFITTYEREHRQQDSGTWTRLIV